VLFLAQTRSAFQKRSRATPRHLVDKDEKPPYRGQSGRALCGVVVRIMLSRFRPTQDGDICKRCAAKA